MLAVMDEYYVQGLKPRSHAGLFYVGLKIGYLDHVFSCLSSVSNKLTWQISLAKA
jgi:hypothetical protein